MRVDLSKLIVIDIEATCWEENKKPDDQEMEIIEIGISICNLDTKTIELSDSIIVRPEYSGISDFCTTLTTLTKEFIDSNGISFSSACSLLTDKYEVNKYVWCSYGDYDKAQFIKDCQKKNVKYPFSHKHINIKPIFSLMYNLRKEVGMKKALTIANIPLEGTHHRGVDDSRNIAKLVLSTIL